MFRQPRYTIALTASAAAASTGLYAAYRDHDHRALSESEVARARGALAQLAPWPPAASRDAVAARHLETLARCGVTVVRETLSPPELREWNAKTKEALEGAHNVVWQSGRAYYNITKRSVHYSAMSHVGRGGPDVPDATDGTHRETNELTWLGALWRSSSSNNSAESRPARPQVSLHDIVRSYFERHGIKRYVLTDIQFLNAYPASTNQIWHRDNTRRGLTAIVALRDVRDNGPTELLLGSHRPDFSPWPRRGAAPAGAAVPDGALVGCIDAGDALLYDARTLHRGRGNAATADGGGGADRPTLVIRWDAAHTPPPGAGIIVTTVNEYVGSILYGILFLLQKMSITSSGDR